MSQVVWDPTLETGDALVDSQHRELMQMFNELHAAAMDGRGEVAVEEILSRLSEYVMVHFEAERRLMLRTRFDPDKMCAHLEQHSDLTARTRDMILRHRAGELTTVLPLAVFLSEWLADHIRTWDKALVAHISAVEARREVGD